MATNTPRSSADLSPFDSLRRAFRSLQQQRFPGSFKKKRVSDRSADSREHHVSTFSIRISDPFRSNEQITNVPGTSSSPFDTRITNLGSTDSTLECPLCMLSLPAENFFSLLTCQHRSCISCLKLYLRIEITEGRVGIACPECPEKLHPADIQQILCDEWLMCKYEEFMLRHVLVLDPDTRWCPAPDCSYAVIASGCASCPQLTCERPGCGTLFCYHCKQQWHPNQTCDAARAERFNSSLPTSAVELGKEQGSQNAIKLCPRCGSLIMKLDDGSCNHMTCAACGAEFCWLCLKEISDLHYLSPSGCTFWGKRPWTRKRKILWQVGMLIGAPVGISLIAGVAFPVIIIGLPILVGRKLMAKCRHMARRKRHLVVASGVIASTLVSPVLAAITVGAGIPMLLAYVYGVVPVSLCRDSCCAGRRQKQASELEFDLKDIQGVSVDPSVSGQFSKTLSSSDISSQTAGVNSRMVVEAEIHPGLARHASDGGTRKNASAAGEVYVTPASSSVSTMAPSDMENIRTEGNLNKNCIVGVSVSDASLNVSSPGACSFSATTVADCAEANNSSSSSTESVHPRLSFRRAGKKTFPENTSTHNATGGAAFHIKSFKRQSMSVGDSIDEKVEAERGYLSLHSLAEEETCLESFAGGSDIVAMVAISEEGQTSDTHGKTRGVRSSTSVITALASDSVATCLPKKQSNGTNIEPTTSESRDLSACGVDILMPLDTSHQTHDIKHCDNLC